MTNQRALSRLQHHLVALSPTSGESPRLLSGTTPIPFEDWHVGDTFVTAKRTISEHDIIQFTQLCGYSNEQLFRDVTYLKSVGHDRRLAPGLLTMSTADALIVGSGVIEGYAVALVGINGFIARRPVYANDTIYVEVRVTRTKLSRSKGDRGVVTTQQLVKNTQGEVVAEYEVSRMLKCRSRA